MHWNTLLPQTHTTSALAKYRILLFKVREIGESVGAILHCTEFCLQAEGGRKIRRRMPFLPSCQQAWFRTLWIHQFGHWWWWWWRTDFALIRRLPRWLYDCNARLAIAAAAAVADWIQKIRFIWHTVSVCRCLFQCLQCVFVPQCAHWALHWCLFSIFNFISASILLTHVEAQT